MSPRSDKLKQSIREVLDSPADLVVMTLLVLFSVFAWDVSRGWLSARVDVIIEGIMTGLFVVFVIEIILMIYVTPRWWREFSIWLFVFATAMMAFEIPWIQSSIFGASTNIGALASLRLIKVFRTLARLGRLLRIIKSLVLSDLRTFISRLVRRNVDAESMRISEEARRSIKAETGKKSYETLEKATTFAVVAIFAIMYITATLLVSSIQRDTSIDRAYEKIVSNPVLYGDAIPLLISNTPDIVYLSVNEEVFVDRRDDVSMYRGDEVAKLESANGAMWIDTREFERNRARREALLTFVFIAAISSLIVVFNWLISRFAVRLSGALNTLARSVEERDAYTKMHSKNVANYAEQVARQLNLSKQDQLITTIAGELHDIGMIGVPQDILGKPASLSSGEYEIIKRHTEEGASILHHLVDFEAVIHAARFHHEKYDGSGYPNGLKGPQIPRTARILAVCDTWDALTTDRPYRRAYETSKAREILLERSGSDFDPEIVRAFVATLVES